MSKKNASMIKIDCMYDGMSITKAGITTFKVKAPYEQISNFLGLVAALAMDLKLAIRKSPKDKFELVGEVRVKALNINKEGDASIQFYGEEIEVPNISSLMDKTITVAVKFLTEGDEDV